MAPHNRFGPRMKLSVLGQHLVTNYRPGRRWWQYALGMVVDAEGGQMTSVTLRRILKEHYGVIVGPYSYGSLLSPGNCDPHTEIGNYVSIGPGVRRFGASHPLKFPSLHPYWYNASAYGREAITAIHRSAIWIGHDSWVGANTVILPQVARIGIGAVIGAGSVVTKDVGDFCIVAGNPARTIGERLTADLRSRLLHDEPWLRSPAECEGYMRQLSERTN
ncbi:CatB-related O-acetyltransferase [Georgenia sp. EYE_87]|uniref:CatB-related O-acetyltransferase n=1 Tax=Georgenia sp. EYE_87 TaxID=2853448 RepID=UPI002002E813|nr:CatB-related O-acetyltransferase [Georgenia sp. EYE_87]MCK6210814.1 CatB-related O-acetyltransferase [Georgenia sp. EYE_87]